MGASFSRELHPAEPPLSGVLVPPRPFLSRHGRFGPTTAPYRPDSPRHSGPARPPSENPRFAGNAPLARPPPETREIGLSPCISA